jgi:sugar lactone lactonase YvrE
MENINYKSLPIFFAALFMAFLAQAQTPYTVVATGLKLPAGLEVDADNRLWLNQSGTGQNDGSVGILNANGSFLPVVTGLPSKFNQFNDIDGPWHTIPMPNNQIAVVTAGGVGTYTGSVLFFNLTGFVPGVSAPKTPAMNMRHIPVSDFMVSKGFPRPVSTNPFSIATDATNNLYVSDAAGNSLLKFDAANNGTILHTLPDFANPTPIGGPFINQVPTRIIARPSGGFYVATLTGFPFIAGKASIYTVSTEGVVTLFKTGFNALIDLAIHPQTGDLYALQHAESYSLQTQAFVANTSKVIRINADGSTKDVFTGFGPAFGMAFDQSGNLFVSEITAGRVLKFSHSTIETSTAFFNENFNRGIPLTWSSVDSTGNSAKFMACDSTCLQDWDTRYTSGFYNYVNFLDDTENGIGWASFRSGSVALKAFRQKDINATLTSPAINCTGKNKVFLRFATVIWGGANADSVGTSVNAISTCRLRVSRDGRNWTDYKIFDFNIRVGQPSFFDISEVAANQSRIFIQFKRTGNEDNQIWAVDEVGLFDTAPLRAITVSVDMSNERVSPKGVYIANDLKGEWRPNAAKMTDMGSGIYKAMMQVPQGTTAHYKFMNGDSWGENESVLSGCGAMNSAGSYDRIATGYNGSSYEIPTVCFGACMACGNRKPQSTYVYCPRDPSLIYCENFEAMQHDKLVPQATNWTTYSLAINGYTNPMTASDNPQVTSFWKGFTNFDGSHALKITGDPITLFSDDPLMYLGKPTEGVYQIDFKVYVAKNRSGMVSVDDADGNSGFTMDFSGDSLYLLEFPDYATGELHLMGKPVIYKQNDWNDLSLIFNASTNKMTLKLNNVQVLNAIDAMQSGYGFLEFFAADFVSGFTVQSEFYIDDIVYRRLPDERPLAEFLKKNKTMDISPNPANERLTLSPDVNTTDAWQIKLLNNVGQVIATHKGVGASSIEIATQDYNSGMYIVEFQSEETRWTKKVVIQH